MKRSLALLAVVVLSACRSHPASPADVCQQALDTAVSTDSAVDLLFVVDDSFSMDPIQDRLASNLEAFIERVAQRQRERVAAGKDPFDLHIAVTSTSVLVNRKNADSCNAGVCNITTPTAGAPHGYPCTAGPCADIVTTYYNAVTPEVCLPGVMKANGAPFPAGDFVAAGTNPTTLAFTGDLDWANASTDAKIRGLIEQFKANVKVGSCGAAQEMPFEAARRAISKSLAGQQGGVWPHENSRIGVVFVSNEDDCSTKRADEGGLVWEAGVEQDSCSADAQRETPVGLTPNGEYVSYFTGLGRPFSAAFVRPGFADCNGAGGAGTRTHALAAALTSAGAGAVEASVCGDFVGAVEQIAGIVEPPDWVALPKAAASGVVTSLRVSGSDGTTAHVCDGPDRAGEWWFVDCATGAETPAGKTSGCVRLKAGSACDPAALQTLRAAYVDAAATTSSCSISGN